MMAIWWERKMAGHMQSRIGPNRVGPFGLLQSMADGIKLILKEDLIPKDADAFLFKTGAVPGVSAGVRGVSGAAVCADLTFEPR